MPPGIHLQHFNFWVVKAKKSKCSFSLQTPTPPLSCSHIFLAAGGSAVHGVPWCRFVSWAWSCQHATSYYSQESSSPGNEDSRPKLVPGERDSESVKRGKQNTQYIHQLQMLGCIKKGSRESLEPVTCWRNAQCRVTLVPLDNANHTHTLGRLHTYLELTGVKGS